MPDGFFPGGFRRFPRRRFRRFPRFFFPFFPFFPRRRCFFIDRFGRCCDRWGRCVWDDGRWAMSDDSYPVMADMDDSMETWYGMPGGWDMIADSDMDDDD